MFYNVIDNNMSTTAINYDFAYAYNNGDLIYSVRFNTLSAVSIFIDIQKDSTVHQFTYNFAKAFI